MNKGKPVTATIGSPQAVPDARPASLEAVLRARIAEALADPRPGIPAEEVFARLERKARTSRR
jgi:hypothetical protein